ncbi:MAG: hypothetical protein ACYS67_03630 [Planctomycetota bacterium]|jgi:hypothetical protein
MYRVVTQDLPPTEATPKKIKDIINNAVPDTAILVSVTVCIGPNGLQRLVIVFTKKL